MSTSQNSLVPITSDQAWELLREDFTLRQHLLSYELGECFRPKVNAVYSIRRSDSGYVNARIELELKQADYTAGRYFDACCEAWKAQGRIKCRAFFLAVLHYVLIPSFDIRLQIASQDVTTRHAKSIDISIHLGHFKRQMDKLRSKWATKIEIASRDNEYEQKQVRERTIDRQFESHPIRQETYETEAGRLTVVHTDMVPGGISYIEPVSSGTANKSADTKATARKRVGRKAKRDAGFCALAASLLKKEKARTGTIKTEGLERIARTFEKSGFVKPAEFLEQDAAKALNLYNRQFGASDAKKIMTWTALVGKGDKDQIRAMRRMLYHCAADVRK